ncbi:MAG: NACHT domain-containing NTPase [Myxacorys chilensis ATA2-1-KO14]|jgi:predicted NACHT family NTPase|nr:NACHT domain-containing NTPase [Myxacorys chilensis ATA2-1-KO14]
MARSLRASITGIKTAEAIFKRRGWTQEYLAGMCRCTRQVVGNFFARRAVKSDIFQAICAELGLEWGEIAEADEGMQTKNRPSSLNELVATIREIIRDRIQKQYGTMRVLDMSQPIDLDNIYTNVNVLEKITARRRLEMSELLELNNISSQDVERFSLSNVVEECIPGIEAIEKYERLLILGKPGAGKTTFLKHLAIQCISGNWYVDRIPAFITLKDFAEEPGQPSVLQYLQQLLSGYGLASNLTVKTGLMQSLLAWNETSVEQLLKGGRLLVLLDGLDEVKTSDAGRTLRQIRDFADQFNQSQIVMTCRIAAREYTFDQFTEVEVADFNDNQIASFSQKWFHAKDDFVKAERFTEKLKENSRIQELATNPLLLTLLCITFEESGNFPQNRSELYKEGLDILLKKWDIKRNIEREQVYKQLSLQRKEDLLSHIAFSTFEKGDYFFKQKAVEHQIGNYIRNLPSANTTPDDLQLDSEAVLKSIEAQHGLLVERAWKIYSFSHLTFHEFFTARAVALSRQPQQVFQQLIHHLLEKRWREVFLLTVGLLTEADELLQMMKSAVDQIVAKDDELQEFLGWINRRSNSIKASYKPAAIRAFYLDRALNRDRSRDLEPALDFALDHTFDLSDIRNHDREYIDNLDRALKFYEKLDQEFASLSSYVLKVYDGFSCDLDDAPDIGFFLKRKPSLLYYYFFRAPDLNLELLQELQQLRNEIPSIDDWDNKDSNSRQWWQDKGKIWIEKLRALMIQYRKLRHGWQFTEAQKQQLHQYYDANRFLVVCLDSDCYISREVREQIEATLLLPISAERNSVRTASL